MLGRQETARETHRGRTKKQERKIRPGPPIGGPGLPIFTREEPPPEGVSVRRTFGILISARGLVGCAFRCYGWGPRAEVGVSWRAWRPPRCPEKGTRMASQRPRTRRDPGSDLCRPGAAPATPTPSSLSPRPSKPSRARWRSWRRRAACRPPPSPPSGR